MKITISLVLAVLYLVCVNPLAKVEAVSPPPDGGYPGANTAEGEEALLSLTTGTFNTAVGWLSLATLTTGQLNTAIGAGALLLNTADGNSATGAGALLSNTTGFGNTANGTFALSNNTTGNQTQLLGGRRSLTIPRAKAMLRSVAGHSPTIPRTCLT